MLQELLYTLGVDPATYLKSTFETSLIALFILCCIHSCWVHGWKRTIREFTAGFILTATMENIGVLSGAYVYPGFSLYVYATPLLNPLSWVAIVYIVMGFTNGLVYGDKSTLAKEELLLLSGPYIKTLLILACIDASLLVMVDIIEDPLATIYNWWIWVPYSDGVTMIESGVVDPYNFKNLVWMSTPNNEISQYFSALYPEGFKYPTRFLGIPITNFIAWFILVFTFSLSTRWVEQKKEWSDIKKTSVLWALMIPIMLVLPLTILLNI